MILLRDGVFLKVIMRFNIEIIVENFIINFKESVVVDVGRYEIIVVNFSGIIKIFINIIVLDRFGFLIGFVVISDIIEESVIFKWELFKYDGGS